MHIVVGLIAMLLFWPIVGAFITGFKCAPSAPVEEPDLLWVFAAVFGAIFFMVWLLGGMN